MCPLLDLHLLPVLGCGLREVRISVNSDRGTRTYLLEYIRDLSSKRSVEAFYEFKKIIDVP